MLVTVGYLLGKPEDFKICLGCGCFNWYENVGCHKCDSEVFREATQKDVDDYAKLRSRDEHFCMDCELTV